MVQLCTPLIQNQGIAMLSAATSSFTRYAASERLRKLAENPFDLTKKGQLTRERLSRYVASACGYRFLYGTERIDDAVMTALSDLAKEARVIEKMEQMQGGEVMNRIEGFASDNRRVLHTAMRDFFDHPIQTPVALAATAKAKEQHTKLKAWLAKIDREKRFKHLIAVAIGGSDLGPRALHVALKHLQKADHQTHFVSNVDPDDIARVVDGLDLAQTLVIVVSKSGTTIETVTNEELLRERFRQAGLNPREHFLCVTEEGSPMDDPKRYQECFHMWDYVGGRFSATSMGGAVSLAFAFGYPVVEELLAGAHAMDRAARKEDLSVNLPLLGALLSIWNHNFLGYPTLAFIPYSEALSRFSAHMQQVEMESNGKRIDRHGQAVNFQTGPIIWGEPGTNAQHSFYQLIHQGTATIPLEFVGYKLSQSGEDLEVNGTNSQEKLLANLFAQAIALATGQANSNPNKVFPGNRPSHMLLAKQLSPHSLGALFAYIEHKVAFEGFLWDINSFDQQGVQLGKVLASEILGLFSARTAKKPPAEPFPLGECLIKELDKV